MTENGRFATVSPWSQPDALQSFSQALLTTDRSPPLGPEPQPVHASLTLTDHPVPDIY